MPSLKARAALTTAYAAGLRVSEVTGLGSPTSTVAINHANKLSRTWATLLEALKRHRGKGQQKVTVEHVNVHAGGQAVVGVGERPGGGERSRSEEQPHAKQIADAPEPALRSQDAERRPVPVASDEERPLPVGRLRTVSPSSR